MSRLSLNFPIPKTRVPNPNVASFEALGWEPHRSRNGRCLSRQKRAHLIPNVWRGHSCPRNAASKPKPRSKFQFQFQRAGLLAFKRKSTASQPTETLNPNSAHTNCHPERNGRFAKRSSHGVEGPLHPPTPHQGILPMPTEQT